MTDGCDISSEIALWWTSLDLSDDKSTLVQVMAWCRQATSHYLNQCWPRSLLPYGVAMPQWAKVNSLQLIQIMKTCKFHRWVRNLQMCCSGLIRFRGYHICHICSPCHDQQEIITSFLIFSKILTTDTCSLPMRVIYVVKFMSSKFKGFPVSIIIVFYAILCYIGSWYIGAHHITFVWLLLIIYLNTFLS